MSLEHDTNLLHSLIPNFHSGVKWRLGTRLRRLLTSCSRARTSSFFLLAYLWCFVLSFKMSACRKGGTRLTIADAIDGMLLVVSQHAAMWLHTSKFLMTFFRIRSSLLALPCRVRTTSCRKASKPSSNSSFSCNRASYLQGEGGGGGGRGGGRGEKCSI